MQSRLFVAGLALLLLGGCATMPNPFGGQPEVATATVAPAPPAPAALTAGVASPHDSRVAMLLAAGTVPLQAPAIGAYMDQEETALRSQLQSSGVSVTRVGQQIVLTLPSAITFDPEKASIRSPVGTTLTAIGTLLKTYNKTVIDVYGYTDTGGSDQSNKGLSQRRAVAVAAVLAKQGVDQRRFYIQGRGEADPVASNATEIGRAQNRRVEIQLSPIAGTPTPS